MIALPDIFENNSIHFLSVSCIRITSLQVSCENKTVDSLGTDQVKARNKTHRCNAYPDTFNFNLT